MASERTYSVVVACDAGGGIGYKNMLPWKVKEDLLFFRKLTSGSNSPGRENTVIMGRKTYESLPNGPLKNRTNIVVTGRSFNDVMCADSFDAALDLAPMGGDVFAIGGKRVFEEALQDSRCKTVYITKIHGEHQCDVFISLDLSKYQLADKTETARSSSGIEFHRERWVRI